MPNARWKTKKQNTTSNTRLNKTIKKVVNRTLNSNIELKRIENVGTEVAVSSLSTGAAANWFDPFSNIGQGSGSYQRQGNRIKVTGIELNNYFNNNSTTQIWLRFVVLKVYDRTVSGTSSSYFESGTGSATTMASLNGMQSMMRPFHPAQVKPIYDRVIKMSANSGEGANSFTRIKHFIKFPKGLIITYSGSSTGAGYSEPFYQIGCFIAEAPEDIGVGVTCEWTYCNNVYFHDA